MKKKEFLFNLGESAYDKNDKVLVMFEGAEYRGELVHTFRSTTVEIKATGTE